MSIAEMITYLKGIYPTLRGRCWEDIPENQVIAIYYSMRKREENPTTRPKRARPTPSPKLVANGARATKTSENQLSFLN